MDLVLICNSINGKKKEEIEVRAISYLYHEFEETLTNFDLSIKLVCFREEFDNVRLLARHFNNITSSNRFQVARCSLGEALERVLDKENVNLYYVGATREDLQYVDKAGDYGLNVVNVE